MTLDPRVHAYRKDIADIALAGQLIAPHYARPVHRRLAEQATLRLEANDGSEILADMSTGEEFAVLDVSGDWAWGYRRIGHLVGYVLDAALEPHAMD